MLNIKEYKRIARHKRIRKRLKSKPDAPRLCVRRSLKNLYIQLIDDSQSKTVFAFSTLNKEIKKTLKYTGNVKAAEAMGQMAADKLKKKGITRIIFDRGGYKFHGRIKSFVESLKKGGINI